MARVVNGRELASLVDGWQLAGEGPLHQRLAAVLGSLVLDGRLPVQARLPSERDLAMQLGISRPTVTAAYARLRDEGFAHSRAGSGTWTALPSRSNRGVAPLLPSPCHRPGLIDMAIAVLAPDQRSTMAALESASLELRELLAESENTATHGYYQAGVPTLRESIAQRYTSRGLPTTADQIFVTIGAQGAIHQIVTSQVSMGDHVVIEQPTYPNAVDTLRAAGARLVPVPVSVHGWQIDQVIETIDRVRPRLAYMILDHHNPTGARLPAEGRAALAAAVRRCGTLLVVDETLAELSLDGELPLPVAAYDQGDRVISIGSLSKVLWGGLRVGWIRTSASRVSRLALNRARVDLAGPVIDQLAAAHLVRDLDHLLPSRLDELRTRREVLVAALRDQLPQWEVTVPPGGLSLWVRMDRPISTALADAAEHHSVRISPGPRFGLDGTLERFVRLPFSLPAADLISAVDRLTIAAKEAAGFSQPHVRTPTVATGLGHGVRSRLVI